MASKRPRSVYDSRKFVSEEASSRYAKTVGTKNVIPERGLVITPGKWPDVEAEIARRGWTKFCIQPEPAVVPVVCEFYANAPEHVDGRVRVRQQEVAFDRTTINQFFSLPNIEDEYTAYLDKVDFGEVTGVIWPNGTQRKYHRELPNNAKDMDWVSKVWHYFVSARLLPQTEYSYVTRERAVLIYAIRTGMSIDVGRLLFNNICHSARGYSEVIYYPSLITALCTKAGVAVVAGEQILPPKSAIADHSIWRLINRESTPPPKASCSCPPLDASSRPATEVSESRPPLPRSAHQLSITDRLSELEGQLQRHREEVAGQFRRIQGQLRNQARQQADCFTTVTDMMRIIAQHQGVDMSQFPSLTPYIPHARASSGEEGDDDA